jgi:HEPN domain-containing protein
MKTPRDHAASLMLKASHDLIAARAILSASDAFDTACFHAQQAVEKSLKAVLALHEIE